jgi:hypothetical protein
MWFFFPTIIYYVIGLKPDVDISTILMFNESQSMIFKNLSKKRLEEVDSILPSLRVYIATHHGWRKRFFWAEAFATAD